ncbi:MAG TPA: EamA family transporter [Actinomycetota bacterium]|nr:EamA family transporter [Actinomycetota bacterium]
MKAAEEPRPDRLTLAAFGALVLMVGINGNAVKATVNELAPLWSAGIRFTAAALILIAVLLIRRQHLPRGRALFGAVLFGTLSFAAFFAFAYWGIQLLPISIAAVIFASVPLITFLAAVLHGLEPFRWLTLAGALIVVVGIALMAGVARSESISIIGILALIGAGVSAAEGAVVAKRFPLLPPIVMNAVGMTAGAVILLVLSFASGEAHEAPAQGATWLALVYLVLLGSIATFITYLFVLGRWTASGTSYEFVLAPIVAVVFAAIFQDERVTTGLVAGGALVLAGVYVGALLHAGKGEQKRAASRPDEAAASLPEETQDRPELAGVPADCVRCP